MHKIVILLSVYRGSRRDEVSLTLESLWGQTYSKFDIFVQQDGPVPEDLEEYLDALLQSGKIEYLGKRKENKGVSYSFNELIALALDKNYEYIVRMDTDDICVPERIEKQYIFMQENTEIDVVGGWIEEYNIDTGQRQIVRYPEKQTEIFEFFKKRSPLANPTTFFRNSFFQKAGLHRLGTTNEDYALWIEGFDNHCRFANLQEVLVVMKVDDNFFLRRHGFKKAWDDFTLKWEAAMRLNFGLTGYLYAVLSFLLVLAPVSIKKILYTFLRG